MAVVIVDDAMEVDLFCKLKMLARQSRCLLTAGIVGLVSKFSFWTSDGKRGRMLGRMIGNSRLKREIGIVSFNV